MDEKYLRITLSFNRTKYPTIVEWIESQNNKSHAIRKAIETEMKSHITLKRIEEKLDSLISDGVVTWQKDGTQTTESIPDDIKAKLFEIAA